MARKDPDSPKPKKSGWLSQLRQVYSVTRANDPKLDLWVFGSFGVVLVVAVLIGWLAHALVYSIVLGLPFAVLAATYLLSRRAEASAYHQIEGQVGAAGAALTALRKGWYFDQEPVAAEAARPGDFASAAMVFRAVGRPGVVLVGEGPTARATKMLGQERRRVERVAPGVPVYLVRVGESGDEDEVSIRKLVTTIQRYKAVLTKDEVATVNKRLRALGGAKPPIPAGIDPNRVRVDRKALRGR